MPVRSMRIKTSLMPTSGSGTSSSRRPTSSACFTNARIATQPNPLGPRGCRYARSVRIRQVHPDEWEALRDVRLAALAESPDAFGATLEEERAFDEARWRGWASGEGWAGEVATFVADDGDRSVGMATGFHPDDEPMTVHLFAMWVRPDRRRSGVGRELVAAVVRWAADLPGVDELTLRVTISNESALRFYV